MIVEDKTTGSQSCFILKSNSELVSMHDKVFRQNNVEEENPPLRVVDEYIEYASENISEVVESFWENQNKHRLDVLVRDSLNWRQFRTYTFYADISKSPNKYYFLSHPKRKDSTLIDYEDFKGLLDQATDFNMLEELLEYLDSYNEFEI
jgi:hypothetical protein